MITLSFICRHLFQHFVFAISGFIITLIPDIPREVKVQIHRENQLEQQIMFDDGDTSLRRASEYQLNEDYHGGNNTTMTAAEIPPLSTNIQQPPDGGG